LRCHRALRNGRSSPPKLHVATTALLDLDASSSLSAHNVASSHCGSIAKQFWVSIFRTKTRLLCPRLMRSWLSARFPPHVIVAGEAPHPSSPFSTTFASAFADMSHISDMCFCIAMSSGEEEAVWHEGKQRAVAICIMQVDEKSSSEISSMLRRRTRERRREDVGT
jgi:hypothetical protein